MMLPATVLVAGEANGPVLRLDAPLSFWGGIDPVTSQVTLAGHPQLGQPIADTVLVLPDPIGSSSSSAVLLELLYRHCAPKALILGARDAILPVGAVVAHQMGWPTIPVLFMPQTPFQTGQTVSIKLDGQIEYSPLTATS